LGLIRCYSLLRSPISASLYPTLARLHQLPHPWPLPLCHRPAPTGIHTLSLHDALPIWTAGSPPSSAPTPTSRPPTSRFCPKAPRSEEHTSELQSRFDLVCRLLLEKKKLPPERPLPLGLRQANAGLPDPLRGSREPEYPS